MLLLRKILENTYKKLYKVDAFLENAVFSEKQKIKEQQYVNDVIENLKSLEEILKQLESCSLDNENEFAKVMVHLHLKLANIAWYFENLHNNVRKIIEHYPLSEKFIKENS